MIDGSILIGGRAVRRNDAFTVTNPATGETLEQSYCEATGIDVEEACKLAASASAEFPGLAPAARADFLDAVALEILAIRDALVAMGHAETGLPRPRLENECGRTIGQLRMFADELRKGVWIDATIDPALPGRVPPRPDLRRMNVALGPVAVFGASNFPLAFSVGGGDTASAFAAGCPVVCKGHPAHPGTGELVARAIVTAVTNCGLPAGVFSFLPGRAHSLGEALVSDSRIKAVAFTGSRSGGLALAAAAFSRPEPIPVYAEMSSINPVVLMPQALATRSEALAEGFATSLTLGAGQFCTNPGLVIAMEGPDLDRFIAAVARELGAREPSVMLTSAIQASYDHGVAALEGRVRRVASGRRSDGPSRCQAAVFETSAEAFLADDTLSREVFGASSVIVRCRDLHEIMQVIAGLEGQLTATLQLEPGDTADAAEIVPLLSAKAGRVLFNGWPTGVEVTAAMVHGGPYPATTDGRSTSVGTLAMMRFLRPVCYQDMPAALLPPALRDENPWALPRRIDGGVAA